MIIRFWLIVGDQRRLGAGDLHRRLHPRHGRHRWLSGPRSCTASPSTGASVGPRAASPRLRGDGRRRSRSTRPSAALAATLGVELRAAPADWTELLVGRRPRVAGTGCARRRIASIRAARGCGVPVRERDRARLPMGAGASPARRPAADAGGHGHRRQDDHDRCWRSAMLAAAGLRTAALGNTDVPLVDAVDDATLDAASWSSARASGWRGRNSSAPTPRRGSTSPPTTSTGTRRWRPTRPPRPASGTSSGPATWRSDSPTTRS